MHCYPTREMMMELVAVIILNFFFKELTRVTIGQFAQDAKCIDHRALIIVVYVSDASEEWTIIVHGKNKDIMFCTIITHQGVWTLDILHYYYEK